MCHNPRFKTREENEAIAHNSRHNMIVQYINGKMKTLGELVKLRDMKDDYYISPDKMPLVLAEIQKTVAEIRLWNDKLDTPFVESGDVESFIGHPMPRTVAAPRCECGAHHTQYPNLHMKFCPLYKPYY